MSIDSRKNNNNTLSALSTAGNKLLPINKSRFYSYMTLRDLTPIPYMQGHALPIQYQYHAITYREKYSATEKNVQNTHTTHYRYSNYSTVIIEMRVSVHSRTTNEVTTCQKNWDGCINGMLLTSK